MGRTTGAGEPAVFLGLAEDQSAVRDDREIDLGTRGGGACPPWLQREPGRFFLATKGDERTTARAREELHPSLDRLGVDHVDLWQLHALADPIEWDTALSSGGALEAAIEAREQGLIRWIGVTGHGSQIAATHRRSLERYDFDSVLLPYNFVTMQQPYYAGNFDGAFTVTYRSQATRGRPSLPRWARDVIEDGR